MSGSASGWPLGEEPVMGTTQGISFEELEVRIARARSEFGLAPVAASPAPIATAAPRPGRSGGRALDVLLLGTAWVGLLALVALAI